MTLILTFLVTTLFWAALLVFAVRRVVLHMQAEPEAVKAISEHVLVPLFGKKEVPP